MIHSSFNTRSAFLSSGSPSSCEYSSSALLAVSNRAFSTGDFTATILVSQASPQISAYELHTFMRNVIDSVCFKLARGRGVLPYIRYIGMCRCEGQGF